MHGSVFPVRSNVVESRCHVVRLVGASTSDPTIAYGTSVVSATRVSAGDLKITFKDNPGNYVGAVVQLQAATPSGVKQYTAVVKDYDSTNLALEVVVYDSGGSAVDLTTAQSVTIQAWFKQTALAG